ncbi:MAG: hypothetical protein V3U46_02345 [Acidimicrobiia bacterium]
MTIYDGVINLDDNQISVIVGFEDAVLRMSSGGAEIGEWAEGDYSIDHDGEGVYTITAEGEALEFIPNNPGLFAATLKGEVTPIPERATKQYETEDIGPERVKESAPLESPDVAPPPKPVTRLAFYALAGVTASLGLWAVMSLLAS